MDSAVTAEQKQPETLKGALAGGYAKIFGQQWPVWIGGVLFGVLSERIGRRRAIVLAALFALPAIPLWAYSATPLMLGVGAFMIQIAVQGAWGVVPVHLNELSPDEARGATLGPPSLRGDA